MINRLLVLLQVIAIPAYFIYFNIIWHDDIESFFEDNSFLSRLPDPLIWFEVNLAIAVFFSLPWVIITIVRATKIANAYTLMGRALGKVRIDQKLFYGINAAFLMIFLILPFGSPLITIIAVFVVFRILSHKAVIGKISSLVWFIPALIVATIPGLIAWAFYSNFSELFDRVLDIWSRYVNDIFYIGLSLAIAITFGNFISFLFERAVAQNRGSADPFRLVYVIKFAMFATLVTIYFAEGSSILNVINIIAALVAGIEFILRRVSKIPSDAAGANLMVFVFIIMNFTINWMANNLNISESFFRAFLIGISGFIFFVLFWFSYKYAEDPELIGASAASS